MAGDTFQGRDPMETLREVFGREQQRYDERRADMAQMRNAILQLSSRPVPSEAAGPVWERVSVDLAPELIRQLVEATTTVVRSSVVSVEVGPGTEPETAADTRGRLARGEYELRTLYPQSAREDPGARAWMDTWAEAGERQRLSLQPPSDFAVFGDSAVMAVATWGDSAADYVLVREPMVVQAFTELFDFAWEKALPVPRTGQLGDAAYLRLMMRGVKDESIARYLGVSLRTVRRRVAALMEAHGAETRFQLGVSVGRNGLGDRGGSGGG
ncbi:hypothetical protein [Knoellia koreensis]|uniref:HTH luxR-type domain-containing protein n=1 Tax=Knoellia koreensis TaxID=2730921 RepID=A0A849HIY9_9MICO|nr:hypothetical protein [Knoellia sp. DB2414S]NNM47905.1 hypothetical protein [Knoellia sp. DB2414S]